MTTPETKAQAGEDLSPAHAVKQALQGFMGDLGTFQSEIQRKLEKQEERLTMLTKTKLSRPALAAAPLEAPHHKAFNAYLRTGDDDGLRGLELEEKALAVSGDGGYLVDPQTSETVKSVLASTASIRAVANVVNVEAVSYDVLIDHGDMGAGWATEASTISETTTPQIDRISIALHELSALPKASQRLLDDSAFDLETWLAGRIADKFARAEADAFINGDGVDKPKGFLSHTIVDEASWAWDSLGYVATGTANDVTPDSIVDVVYALGAQYRANGTFVMNSKV
ncbi:MAG: phage major capsid protein, partial [Pseudomonadota bacterium]